MVGAEIHSFQAPPALRLDPASMMKRMMMRMMRMRMRMRRMDLMMMP
jgi:hypothetical protein